MSTEDEDRVIARALDAGDDDGPVDNQALAEYHEVLAHLAPEERQPPPGLEDRMVAAALARRPARATAIDTRARRRARVRTGVLSATAVAAAIVVAVLVTTRDTSTPAPTGRIETVAAPATDVAALQRVPGARAGSFDTTAGFVVLAPDGRGLVSDLDPASGLVVLTLETAGGDVVLGTASPQNAAIAFSVDRPDEVRAVRLGTPVGTPLGRAELSS